MALLITTIQQGLIYAILGIGVYVSYKILDIPDLTAEGSFPLGALLVAKLITSGVNPFIATILCFLIGSLAGLMTAIFHIKLKITGLLAGILSMTILYSVNLHINGKPNVPLGRDTSLIFDLFKVGNSALSSILLLIIIVAIVKFTMDLFFKTEIGYMLLATGDNETLVKALGQRPEHYKIIGLMYSNGLIALSGAIFAQLNRFADITMGVSIIVVALASIIIGQTILTHKKMHGSTRSIIGAIIYRFIGALALKLGFESMDLRMINGIIVVLFIAYNNALATYHIKRFLKRRNNA